MPDAVSFFYLPDWSVPGLLLNWDLQYHYKFGLGLDYSHLEMINDLLAFRFEVGSFPTNPPAWWKEGDPVFRSPTIAAFDVAWGLRAYEKREHGGAGAAHVYDALRLGCFIDDDAGSIIADIMSRRNETIISQELALVQVAYSNVIANNTTEKQGGSQGVSEKALIQAQAAVQDSRSTVSSVANRGGPDVSVGRRARIPLISFIILIACGIIYVVVRLWRQGPTQSRENGTNGTGTLGR
jgi:hypothetical protein